MKFLNKIYNGIVKVEEIMSNIIMFLIIALTFLAAMSRAFDFPLPWSLDLILLLFAWFAFLAASQATRKKAHIGVEILVRRLPVKLQHVIEAVNKILIIGFLMFIGYNGIVLSIANVKRQITSLNISYSFITMSLSVGCMLMLLEESIQLIKLIRVLLNLDSEKVLDNVEGGNDRCCI